MLSASRVGVNVLYGAGPKRAAAADGLVSQGVVASGSATDRSRLSGFGFVRLLVPQLGAEGFDVLVEFGHPLPAALADQQVLLDGGGQLFGEPVHRVQFQLVVDRAALASNGRRILC